MCGLLFSSIMWLKSDAVVSLQTSFLLSSSSLFFACAKRRNLRSLSNYLQRKVWKATKTWKYFVWIGDKKCNGIHPLALRRLGLLFTMPINLELHTHFFSKEISSKNTKCFNNKKVAEDFQLFDTRHQSTMHHRQLYLKECE